MYLEYSMLNEIRVNDTSVVLTQQDGWGWIFECGEHVILDINGHPFDMDYGELVVGLMKNDILYTGYVMGANNHECEILITEKGLYHFCIFVKEE